MLDFNGSMEENDTLPKDVDQKEKVYLELYELNYISFSITMFIF